GVEVADVCLAVPDDGGELDQPAYAEAPDGVERWPEPDVRLRLRALRRCAVERPLEPRLVDPDRLLPAPEVDGYADRGVVARRDADLEAALGAAELGQAVLVGDRLAPGE